MPRDPGRKTLAGMPFSSSQRPLTANAQVLNCSQSSIDECDSSAPPKTYGRGDRA